MPVTSLAKLLTLWLIFSGRGGARNLPTEGLELPTGGLKRLKNGVSVRYFARVPPTRTKVSSDGGAVAP